MTLVRSVGRFRTHDVPADPSWAGEARMRRDDEEPETIEIHNHIPTDYGMRTSEEMDRRSRDDEDPDEEEFVELLPPDHFARETADGTAIYRRRRGRRDAHIHNAEHANLAFHDHRARARDQRPPHTLAELNDLHRQFYAKSHAVR